MDAARTAVRLGAKEVHIVYADEVEMPARVEEVGTPRRRDRFPSASEREADRRRRVRCVKAWSASV